MHPRRRLNTTARVRTLALRLQDHLDNTLQGRVHICRRSVDSWTSSHGRFGALDPLTSHHRRIMWGVVPGVDLSPDQVEALTVKEVEAANNPMIWGDRRVQIAHADRCLYQWVVWELDEEEEAEEDAEEANEAEEDAEEAEAEEDADEAEDEAVDEAVEAEVEAAEAEDDVAEAEDEAGPSQRRQSQRVSRVPEPRYVPESIAPKKKEYKRARH
jgi:hypothetical protein